MDIERETILKLLTEHDVSLSTASKAMGRNHAFMHQYFHRNTPFSLRDKDRRSLERFLGVPAGILGFEGEIGKSQANLLHNYNANVKPERRVSEGEELQSNVDLKKTIKKLPAPGQIKDLPVYASAAAGEGFRIVTSDPIEWIYRPAQLVGVTNAFAFYIHGDSMWPRYKHGEMAWAHPRPPQRGKDAVIIISQKEGEMEVLVKNYLQTKDNKIYLEQYNPPQQIILEQASVVNMYSIGGGLWDP